jgi:signal transduction histidine kinase
MMLPRRTARLRLTALYGALFVACGTILLAVTYLLVAVTGNPTSSGGQVHPRLADPSAAPSAGQTVPLGRGLSADQIHQIQSIQRADETRVVGAVLRELLIQSPIALAIVAALAVLLGWLVAGRVLRPLATITATAQRISASNLHQRLNLTGPDDELKALGDTLDALFTRLEASFQAQRHFIANASHELRTPITRERTMLQIALDNPASTTETWRATARDVLASNSEQEDLIEALLTLASSEGGLAHREPVDLAAVTDAVLRARRPEIDRLDLHTEAATRPATLHGDPVLVERLVANLVDNAIHHNIAGGRIALTTATGNDRAVLSVTSTGPVVPAADIDRLFQPFQRLTARHTYRGLGLSIVHAIATAHGADIHAHAPNHGGLTIDITFPIGKTEHQATAPRPPQARRSTVPGPED